MSRPREISGFTLFWNGDKREGLVPSWQMSVRRKDEDGWDVQRISEDQAQAIFRMLISSGHPDGPWKIEAPLVAIMFSPMDILIQENARARIENAEVRNGVEG